MSAIQCTILRGGSSKGIYIERDELPPAGKERDRQLLDIFGSPDVRQIDGLGGADKLTSKVAVMGAPTRADCDIDYLFGQVGTVIPRVDWTSNCGNLSAGAALGSLVFLIVIHKLEYFINARIVGSQIQASAWELLLAMLVMEATFGLPGVVAAPVFYAYAKSEFSSRGLV